MSKPALVFAAFVSAQLLFLILLCACSSQASITPAPTVDPGQQILFYNGIVLTMDPEAPVATALAVTGEKISAVGSDYEILALNGGTATLIDLQGATLMPGSVDAQRCGTGRDHLSGPGMAEAAYYHGR